MASPTNSDLHAPEKYDEIVNELADEVQDGIEADPELTPDEIARERVEEWIFNTGIETAAFVSRNSEKIPGEYEPFTGEKTAANIYEAVAYTQLFKDVYEKVVSRTRKSESESES